MSLYAQGMNQGGPVIMRASVLSAVVLAMLCVLPAAAADQIVLNNYGAKPFMSPEGDGYFDVVVVEAFRRAGIDVHITPGPASRALAATPPTFLACSAKMSIWPVVITDPASAGERHLVRPLPSMPAVSIRR